MKQAKIRKLFESKMKLIAEQADDIGAKFDKDTIHNFRVGVKSIRSFLRLYWMYTGVAKPQLTSKFNKLYRVAGAIRDLQLKLEKNKNALPASYFDALGRELFLRKREWEIMYEPKIIRKMAKRLSKNKFLPLPIFVLLDFANSRIETIEELRQKEGITYEELHTIRKLVKDITHNTKTAGISWRAAHKLLANLPTEQLDKLSSEIGDFNDARLLSEHLFSFAPTELGKDDKKAISVFNKRAVKELKQKRETILSGLAQLAANNPLDEL